MSNPYDLSEFEKRLEARLSAIAVEKSSANPSHNPGNPGKHNPERGVISAEEWVEDMLTGAEAKVKQWKARALNPRYDPITAAIKAWDKFVDRVRKALEDEVWLNKMKRLTFDDVKAGIEVTPDRLFFDRMKAKKAKILKRIGELQPLVDALSKEIRAMPEATDAEREARMLAARRGMLAIGRKLKGVT